MCTIIVALSVCLVGLLVLGWFILTTPVIDAQGHIIGQSAYDCLVEDLRSSRQ